MAEEKKQFDKVKYNNAFIAQSYDRINLTVPKGQKEVIKAHADSNGESVNAFINRAIDETMKREDSLDRKGGLCYADHNGRKN